jgi:hypothetical protein
MAEPGSWNAAHICHYHELGYWAPKIVGMYLENKHEDRDAYPTEVSALRGVRRKGLEQYTHRENGHDHRRLGDT